MITIRTGDCKNILRELPDESVHCVVTSPPYWGLRDYGTAKWEGGDAACNHRRFNGYASGLDGGTEAQDIGKLFKDICGKCGAHRIDAQLGLEPDLHSYVAGMVEVFREVRRVLRKDGTLWLNLGDSYASTTSGTGARGGSFASERAQWQGVATRKDIPIGLKPKDLCGIPWRVAFALQQDGWYLRQDIIWSKPNPMPESVTDRCTKAHEYLFLLTKSERYYYDQEAIAEPVTDSTIERLSQPTLDQQEGSWRVPGKTNGAFKAARPRFGAPGGKAEIACGSLVSGKEYLANGKRNKRSVWEVTTQPFSEAHFATFPPALIKPCINAGCPAGGTVLDPFAGAGTTGLVADRLQRNAILIELNPTYADMSQRRITDDAPLFAIMSQEHP
jgi:DNA modification methylase